MDAGTHTEEDPFGAMLAGLERRGVVGSYTRSPSSLAGDDRGTGSVSIQLSGYALSAHGDRLPVLPVTLELCRHRPERVPQSIDVSGVDDGWQLTFRSERATDGAVS